MTKKRIYIVEDEALIAMELRDRLTHMGYDVCGQTARGETALEEIPRLLPDVAIMDIKLAGELTGVDVALQLRQRADVPIVFLTAFSGTTVDGAVNAEPFGYLVKPFEPAELDATIRTTIHKHKMDRERAHTARLETQLRIAGAIAHDFNNILAVAMGNLELVQLQGKLSSHDPEAAGFIDNAMEACRSAAALTRRLVACTSASAGVVGRATLSEIVSNRSEVLRSLAGPAHALHLKLASDLPSITADEDQLGQAVEQLVMNSAEAIGGAPGEISINTGVMECDEAMLGRSELSDKLRPGMFAYLEVADNGRGMETATLRRAFDLFFTTGHLGRGLGLPFVYGIVRSHKGGVLVDSQEGLGTNVRLIFPVSPGAAS